MPYARMRASCRDKPASTEAFSPHELHAKMTASWFPAVTVNEGTKASVALRGSFIEYEKYKKERLIAF